jgi:hypothetical protein
MLIPRRKPVIFPDVDWLSLNVAHPLDPLRGDPADTLRASHGLCTCTKSVEFGVSSRLHQSAVIPETLPKIIESDVDFDDLISCRSSVDVFLGSGFEVSQCRSFEANTRVYSRL